MQIPYQVIAIDPLYEENALCIEASRLRAFLKITLQLVAPDLLTSSLIVFVNSSTTFIAPITLGRAILEEIRLTLSARDIKDEVLVCIRVDDIDIVSDKRKKLYLNVVKAEIENSVFSGRALILKAKLNDQIIINLTAII